MLDDAQVSRILSITAHPDDVDFAAAGTVARWTEAGIEVVYCVVTDGDVGGFDENFPRAEMAPLRRAEQVAAAKCVRPRKPPPSSREGRGVFADTDRYRA